MFKDIWRKENALIVAKYEVFMLEDITKNLDIDFVKPVIHYLVIGKKSL